MTKDLLTVYDCFMTYASISDLKINPASIISASLDYPVEIQKRSKTQAYLVGKELFDRMVAQLEDIIDSKAVEEANYDDGIPFEKVVADLGLDL